jgi:hypothetical protein
MEAEFDSPWGHKKTQTIPHVRDFVLFVKAQVYFCLSESERQKYRAGVAKIFRQENYL